MEIENRNMWVVHHQKKCGGSAKKIQYRGGRQNFPFQRPLGSQLE